MDTETPAQSEPTPEDREFIRNIYRHWGLISDMIRVEATGVTAFGTRLTLTEMMEATRAAWRREDKTALIPLTVIPTPDQTSVVSFVKKEWTPMETAFAELTEYLRLRRQAEEFYQSHPEIQALLNDLHMAAADKLTPDEGKRLSYEVSQYANEQEIQRVKAGWAAHRATLGNDTPSGPSQ